MTAVEWLQMKMATSSPQEMVENINVWFKEAKQMEKARIIDAFNKGEIQGLKSTNNSFYSSLITAEDYYNETYGKESDTR